LPGLELSSADVIGHIDELCELGGDDRRTGCAARGGYVTIRGWLLDRAAHRPADALAIQLDAGPPIETISGLPRPDVAEVFGQAATASGFAAAIPVLSPLGAHSLSLLPHIDGRSSRVELRDVLRVLAAPDPFAGLERRPGQWAVCVDGAFDKSGSPLIRQDGAYIVPEGVEAELRFWAIDRATLMAPLAIVVRLGGRHVRIASSIERPDAAASVGATGAERCGYVFPLLAPLVGTEQLDIFGLDADGGYSQLASVLVRQPRPLRSSILPQTGAIAGELDEVSCEGIPLQRRGEFSAAIGQTLRLIGWAVDTIGPRLTGGIEIQIDGVAIVETQTSLARGDVAAQHGSRGVSDCGFDCGFRVPNLRLGMHALVVCALSARRDATTELARLKLTVRRAASVG
jgi:hypothetical protein